MSLYSQQFQDLMVEQIPRLRRYAYSLTNDSNKGDDLVQECLERAWSRRQLYDNARPIRPWLFTILHNLFVNHVRRTAAEPMTISTEHPDAIAAHASSGNDPTGMIELGELQHAIEQLPEQHRQVLMLVALEQLSYKETAQVLSVPIGTVMSRLSRARKRLREQLQNNANRSIRRVK